MLNISELNKFYKSFIIKEWIVTEVFFCSEQESIQECSKTIKRLSKEAEKTKFKKVKSPKDGTLTYYRLKEKNLTHSIVEMEGKIIIVTHTFLLE